MTDYNNSSLIPTGGAPSKLPSRVVGAAAGAVAAIPLPVVGPLIGAVAGAVFGPRIGFINKAADKGVEQLGKWAGRS